MKILLLALLGLLAFGFGLPAAETASYQPAGEIQIGGEGGWDILTIDGANRRLYLSHSTKVVVVDIDTNKVVGEILDTPGVHAFMAIPEAGRGFSANGKENKSSVVDLKTLQTTAKLETGKNPDAMAYDAKRGEVYVFNHSGGSATVIGAKTAEIVATVTLGGNPEFGVADRSAGRVYCNLEDKSEVAVIDTERHEVVAHWSLAPGKEPSGIALDSVHHRLFAACNNHLLVMLDTDSGKVTGTVPIGEHVDGCAFDEATQLVFASCGDGTTTIAKEEAPDRLTVMQTLQTERGARTIALDPKTHRIFLPTAQFEPETTPATGTARAWPKIVPNTLKLLVYGPGATPAS